MPRQLRLRDIGGIIVIDFIDMEIEANKRAVLEELRERAAQGPRAHQGVRGQRPRA